MIDFASKRLLSFDCYGTLIDWESGILSTLRPMLSGRGVAVDDERLWKLYGEVESAAEHGPYMPYRQVMATALRGLGERLGFTPSDAECARFADSAGDWPPFADTPAALVSLGRRFRLAIISNIVDASGKPIGALGSDEAFWHTDSSFTETPISASLLHAIEVTEQGGETAFLNMYKAYEDMPAGLAARVNGKYANHSKVHNSAGVRRREFADVTDPSKAPGVKHPIVRTHPVTRRKCLYLGRRLNSYIFDLPLDQSEQLLDEIWAHACQDKYVWQHKWRVGDLLVWDNRCTMHHRNAFAPNARRLMHKSTTAGEPVV